MCGGYLLPLVYVAVNSSSSCFFAFYLCEEQFGLGRSTISSHDSWRECQRSELLHQIMSDWRLQIRAGSTWRFQMKAFEKRYNMVGSDMRLCTHDGWNGQVPTCKIIRCQPPKLSANIQIVAGFGPVYRYQETITYKCNEGFEMMGDNVIECNEDSTFVPPPPTCKHQFPPINIFKEMIAMGRQLIIKEESMIKTNYRLLESQREILRLKEKIIEKAEQYIDEN
uniref:zona pellucida sperm-binding protein 3 receptor-like isoform X3 n=1 Tax=Pristiophorus japonicus TaxID=55135 RepID=UPI00398E94DF